MSRFSETMGRLWENLQIYMGIIGLIYSVVFVWMIFLFSEDINQAVEYSTLSDPEKRTGLGIILEYIIRYFLAFMCGILLSIFGMLFLFPLMSYTWLMVDVSIINKKIYDIQTLLPKYGLENFNVEQATWVLFTASLLSYVVFVLMLVLSFTRSVAREP